MRPARAGRAQRRRIGGVVLAAIAVAGAAGCSPRRAPVASTIHIRGFQFASATDTVQAGDTVVWTNDDIVPHTATDRGKSFDSGTIESGGAWRWVARAPGTFVYECALHPTMRGTLVVR